MFLLKMVGKALAVPVMLVLTLAKWIAGFLVGFSSAVFNILAGLFFLTGVASYILGLTAGSEALKMLIVGFAIFMVPIIGDWVVNAISTVNTQLRGFIHS